MKKYLTLRRKRDELGVVADHRRPAGGRAPDVRGVRRRHRHAGQQKHQLNDTLDAAAQAGAYDLPGSSTTAKADALAFALAHDPIETGSLEPNVDFWCIVASKLASGVYQPDSTQMPSTCYPGTGAYTAGVNYKTTGRKISCSTKICAIPCVEPVSNTGTPKIACNTIRVFQGRTVAFAFAPAGGIQQGSTGNVVSVACKGSCGTIAPNPMDVAIVADRTGSMDSADLIAMRDGIKGMLQVMTPEQQYVALGTIGRATVSSTPSTEPSGACSPASGSATTGAWLPVPFSNELPHWCRGQHQQCTRQGGQLPGQPARALAPASPLR